MGTFSLLDEPGSIGLTNARKTVSATWRRGSVSSGSRKSNVIAEKAKERIFKAMRRVVLAALVTRLAGHNYGR